MPAWTAKATAKPPRTSPATAATNREALVAEQVTMMGALLGEDEVIRGMRERRGPPVGWNGAGTVCE